MAFQADVTINKIRVTYNYRRKEAPSSIWKIVFHMWFQTLPQRAKRGGQSALWAPPRSVLGFLPFPADDAVRLAELSALRDGEERAPAPHQGRLRGQHVR